MSEIELKPCPFCGSKAHLFKSGAGYWGTCTNEECECETPGRTDPSDAAYIWNRRAVRPAVPEEVEGMNAVEPGKEELVELLVHFDRLGIKNRAAYQKALEDFRAALSAPLPERERGDKGDSPSDHVEGADEPCLWDCADAPMEICPTSGKPCPSQAASIEGGNGAVDKPKLQLKAVHIRLLKRGAEFKWIGLADDAGARMAELGALGDLERAGMVRPIEDELPSSPPSMRPRQITEAGRAALATASEGE